MKKRYWIILLVVFLLPVCVYHKITHMNSEELDWVRVYNEGDSLFFSSNTNDIDTAIVTSIEIYNSLSPFNTNPNANSVYEAIAYLNYVIIHDNVSMEGWTCICKREQDQPIEQSFTLCDRYAFELKFEGFKETVIRGTKFNDCIILDDRNSHYGKNQPTVCGISGMVWSKSKGLLQYSFENGDIYTLILGESK